MLSACAGKDYCDPGRFEVPCSLPVPARIIAPPAASKGLRLSDGAAEEGRRLSDGAAGEEEHREFSDGAVEELQQQCVAIGDGRQRWKNFDALHRSAKATMRFP